MILVCAAVFSASLEYLGFVRPRYGCGANHRCIASEKFGGCRKSIGFALPRRAAGPTAASVAVSP